MTTRTEHLSGVVRAGHPLAAGPVTPERRCEFDHLAVSRRGRARGPIDVELRRRGLERRVIAIVPAFYPALAVVAATDPVAFASTAIVDTGRISGAVAVPPPSRHRPATARPATDRDRPDLAFPPHPRPTPTARRHRPAGSARLR